MRKFIAILMIALIVLGCDFYEQNDYQEFYVVESYLVANSTLPLVRLSTTSPISEEYRFNRNAISNATVEIRRLNPDSTIADRYVYEEEKPGIYLPSVADIVQDQQLYQLIIITEDDHRISSLTYVPKKFTTVNQLSESYIYQNDQQVEITITPSAYITGRQAYFIFNVNALHPDSASLTPFYRDLVLNRDNAIGSYYKNASGILNESNYSRNSSGNIQLKVPWLAVAFYDTNEVIVNILDDNMYNFLRSQSVQTGGTTIAPGEIQNIRYNVKGGIGIFGSMSSDTNRVVIKSPE